MIFSHQDVPSFVGKSCQDVPSLVRKNQWVRSCLSLSMLLQCSQLQNGTSYSSVLMIFSHQDVPSFVGMSCQDVPSFVGMSCQDVPSLDRKNQWVRSSLFAALKT